jgi:2-polyprenyl-3-methyl-5-hydroxy-6-metoxy-1,4-benzoquinol methylase
MDKISQIKYTSRDWNYLSKHCIIDFNTMSSNSSNNPYDKKLSDQYSSKYRFDHPHQFMAYSTWLQEIGDIKGKRILDLACGSGTSSRMLAERGAHVTGIDISESMLALAKKEETDHPMNINYILGDASLPKLYANETFDMVVAAFLLHYASSRKMLDGILQNVSLNLKPGGRFVTINLNPEHPIISPGENISHSSKWLDKPFADGSRIEVILWTKENEQICTLTDYHWSTKTYEESLAHAELESAKWINVRMHEEGKTLPNWKELEKNNMLVILEAIKNN